MPPRRQRPRIFFFRLPGAGLASTLLWSLAARMRACPLRGRRALVAARRKGRAGLRAAGAVTGPAAGNSSVGTNALYKACHAVRAATCGRHAGCLVSYCMQKRSPFNGRLLLGALRSLNWQLGSAGCGLTAPLRLPAPASRAPQPAASCCREMRWAQGPPIPRRQRARPRQPCSLAQPGTPPPGTATSQPCLAPASGGHAHPSAIPCPWRGRPCAHVCSVRLSRSLPLARAARPRPGRGQSSAGGGHALDSAVPRPWRGQPRPDFSRSLPPARAARPRP